MLCVSIGIPAYNEEANIYYLLKSLLSQKEKDFTLKEILVISDGSTDKTCSEVEKIKDGRVRLLKRRRRKGQSVRQNELLKLFKSDVFVLLEADVLPVSDEFLFNLINPFLSDKKVDLVWGESKLVEPVGFFESVMNFSWQLKVRTFANFKNDRRSYPFILNGHAGRVFSKRLMQKINWPEDIPEDTYTFLFAKRIGAKIVYQPKAVCCFKAVDNLKDYYLQTGKYVKAKANLFKYFSKGEINSFYKIPKFPFIKEVIVSVFRNPVRFFSYIFILFLARINNLKQPEFSPFWDIYKSSKMLDYNLKFKDE